jgi:hypothetical protein
VKNLTRLLWLVLALGLPACRCSGPEPDANPDASDPLAGCRNACAAYTEAKCDAAGDHAACVRSCSERARRAEVAGCGALRDAYFECVARSTIACPTVGSSSGAALELGEGAPACAVQLAALDRCDAPCRNEGSTHLGEAAVSGKQVKAELTRSGCNDCTKDVRGGAPPGSPCTAASVCPEYCCSCPASPGRYRARACVQGACAATVEACLLAPSAAHHFPCGQ